MRNDSHVFHRKAGFVPPRAVSGKGIWVTDASGRRYMDACGGAAVSCLGHGDDEINAAIRDQLDQIAYVHTGMFTTGPAEDLAADLAAHAPGDLNRVYFVCDGSEAIECALKMAHQYHRERGEPGRHRIISRRQSYHGNTLGALSAGGNLMRRAIYQDILIPACSMIAPCYAYREAEPGESLEDYGQRAAAALEAEILRLGPETVSCFLAETVVGATLGCAEAAPGYFARIREICDRYGVLLIIDEVMCGLGRCGTLHAFEAEGIIPDIVTLAKGLGGGYLPLGAVLCRDTVFGAISDGGKGFMHGHTFSGHAVLCAAALAVQRAVRERDLIANVQLRGAQLRAGLAAALAEHPHVGDIRGRGLFYGIELVADRASKAPFAPEVAINQKVAAAGLARGLISYPMAGTIDGVQGDHLLLAPPYTVSAAEIDEIVGRFAEAVQEAARLSPR